MGQGKAKLPKALKRSKKILLSLTPAEYSALVRAAKRERLAEFSRRAVLRTIRYKPREAKP